MAELIYISTTAKAAAAAARFELLEYSSYSPYIVLSDYRLFIKEHLTGKRF